MQPVRQVCSEQAFEAEEHWAAITARGKPLQPTPLPVSRPPGLPNTHIVQKQPQERVDKRVERTVGMYFSTPARLLIRFKNIVDRLLPMGCFPSRSRPRVHSQTASSNCPFRMLRNGFCFISAPVQLALSFCTGDFNHVGQTFDFI